MNSEGGFRKSEVGPVFALQAWGFALRATTGQDAAASMRKADMEG